MSIKRSLSIAAAFCAIAHSTAYAMPNALPEARTPPQGWGVQTTTIMAESAESETSGSDTVSTVVLTAPASSATTITSNIPYSTMNPGQIMDVYSSLASNVNSKAIESMSSIMGDAQEQNNAYWYYANWYISSNAAKAVSASAVTISTVSE